VLPDVLLGVVDCVVFFVGDFVGDFVGLLSISSIESKMILIKRHFCEIRFVLLVRVITSIQFNRSFSGFILILEIILPLRGS
jgi:hypothetical protein